MFKGKKQSGLSGLIQKDRNANGIFKRKAPTAEEDEIQVDSRSIDF